MVYLIKIYHEPHFSRRYTKKQWQHNLKKKILTQLEYDKNLKNEE